MKADKPSGADLKVSQSGSFTRLTTSKLRGSVSKDGEGRGRDERKRSPARKKTSGDDGRTPFHYGGVS